MTKRFAPRRFLPPVIAMFALAGWVTLNRTGAFSQAPTPDQEVPADGQGSAGTTTAPPEVLQAVANLAHAACFEDDPFPSAKKCQKCHEEIFREWSVSQHAYAQLSPVFNAFSNTTIKLTFGTNGDFCIRCHTPVGMALHEPINISQVDRHPTSREGVTCVVCHRINQPWAKISARQHLVPGNIHQVIFGPRGNEVLAEVLANPDKWGAFKTFPNPELHARDVHHEVVPFFQLVTPAFCGTCHDVFAPNGFRLEDAFSEFRASPAARCEHLNCQDCHMGRVQGYPSGYAIGPAAKVGNANTPPRKRTNHMIVGPDYSIIHPGLFPHHPYAIREPDQSPDDFWVGLATMREWLQFDVDSGWGTYAFESKIPEGYQFPKYWENAARRFRAREILDYNIHLLKEATMHRRTLLAIGYRLGEIETERADDHGIKFRIKVWNGTNGHGVPTGFDAERVVFLQVTVRDREGTVVFKSGDYDPNGDLRDNHSIYVRNQELPLDRDLFSLQSKFIVRTVRGGERAQILNIPYSIDPLPYIRPETHSFTALGRPVVVRKQKQNIEVAGHRWAKYHVKACELTGQGPYTATVKLVVGMVPINLVHAVSEVGFDYGMSELQIARNILAGHMVLHERQAVFDLP